MAIRNSMAKGIIYDARGGHLPAANNRFCVDDRNTEPVGLHMAVNRHVILSPY